MMEIKNSYIESSEIENLIDYCKTLMKVEEYKANFHTAETIKDIIDRLELLDVEVGVLN